MLQVSLRAQHADVQTRMLLGLRHLQTIVLDHTPIPIEQAFNWHTVADFLRVDDEAAWYAVVFRSIRRPDACSKTLYDADAAAHQEAQRSGGLLSYYYGDVDAARRCLAMCIWDSVDAARKASHQPLHRRAAMLAGEMYEWFALERYWITKQAGARALVFTPHL